VIVLVRAGTVLSTGPLIRVVGKTFLPQTTRASSRSTSRPPGGFTLAESSRVFGEIEHQVRNLRA